MATPLLYLHFEQQREVRNDELDDPLYDDKTSSEISIEELVSVIEKSASVKKRIRRKLQFRLANARR